MPYALPRLSLFVALVAVTGLALAEDPKKETGPMTATIGFVSDYTFRGITQTSEHPALQGTFEYAHSSGLYAGLFASTVAFADSTGAFKDTGRLETDLSAGYRFEALGLSWDVGGIAYLYPDQDRKPLVANSDPKTKYNWYEYQAKTTYEAIKDKLAFTVGYNHSNNYWADSGKLDYLYASTKIALPFDATLQGSVGHSKIKYNSRFGAHDYNDWMIGIGREFFGVLVELRYVDTNISKRSEQPCADGCDPKAILAVSFSF